MRRAARRVAWAGLSVLTVVVAVLGAKGLLPVDGVPPRVFGDIAGGADPSRGSAAGPTGRRPDRSSAPAHALAPTTPALAGTPTTPSILAAAPTPRAGFAPSAGSEPGARPTTTAPTDPVPLPPHSGRGRRIVYALAANRVWLVDAHEVVRRTYLVSGTRFGQVRPGRYDVIRKRRYTTSYHGTERMEYMVTFTFGKNAAIGFHDIPVSIETGRPVQTLAQLGQSLSDGCVRQARPDAKALWEFAPVGTPVVVVA
jgi:lipoprotein-anchoring transpeptidase ErfK/SrfK